MADVQMKIMLPGDVFENELLRPDKVHTVGMIDPIAGEAIGITLVPYEGDPGFSKPLTVVIPVEKIDVYIDLIRAAQQRLQQAQSGVA